MIWIYEFADGYRMECGDSLTVIELEQLVGVHGTVTIDCKAR